MVVVTPTDRPKLVRNRCFRGVFVLSRCFLDFSVGEGFCHRTESDLFLFLLFTVSLVYIKDTKRKVTSVDL